MNPVEPKQVIFRINASTHDLTLPAVRDVLGLDEGGSLIPSEHAVDAYVDEDEGIAGVHFSGLPSLTGLEEQRTWGSPEFRSAEKWLSRKSPDQIARLRAVGLEVDFCIAGYTGQVPTALLRQLARLGVCLYVIG